MVGGQPKMATKSTRFSGSACKAHSVKTYRSKDIADGRHSFLLCRDLEGFLLYTQSINLKQATTAPSVNLINFKNSQLYKN